MDYEYNYDYRYGMPDKRWFEKSSKYFKTFIFIFFEAFSTDNAHQDCNGDYLSKDVQKFW